MGKFGWSYPPGCSGPPDDTEEPCEVCGKDEMNCVCPECPICEEYGREACYEDGGGGHGLILTEVQVQARKERSEAEKAEREAEDARAKWEAGESMNGEEVREALRKGKEELDRVDRER